MKRLMLMLGLFQCLLMYAADCSSDEEVLSEHPTAFTLILKRLENMNSRFLGGGTHNGTQFGCMDEGKPGTQGLLYAGQFKDDIFTEVPANPLDLNILLSIGKDTYSVYRESKVSHSIIVRQYAREKGNAHHDERVHIKDLPHAPLGKVPFVLKFGHKSGRGARFVALCQAVLSKNQTSVPTVAHMPPEGAVDYAQCRPAYNRKR